MRRILGPLAAACVLLLAGCGGGSTKTVTQTVSSTTLSQLCPQAANGHGSMGACAPKAQLGLAAPRARATGGPIYPDLSNNDPCVCGGLIRSRGQVGLIVKANQGVGFIDSTAVGMVGSARAAGLAVGEYDFDQDYTVSEAQVFVSRLHAAGIYPSSSNTFPAYLDVEYGRFSYTGLLAQISYLRSQGYRVGIYTGDWYWGPHAGCRWPSGLSSAWLSGYPNAPVPCGTTGYNSHQFTSTPIDLSVFLGSLDQFHAFVNAGPPPALTRARIAARGKSLHAFYQHGCRAPVLTSGICGRLAWRVDHYQKLVDTAHGYYPRCFGHDRNLGAAECQIVRRAVAVWTGAVKSSHHAWAVNLHCIPPTTGGPLPPKCRPPYRRMLYFQGRINHTLATSRL